MHNKCDDSIGLEIKYLNVFFCVEIKWLIDFIFEFWWTRREKRDEDNGR